MNIRAKKGVIISTGGHTGNVDFRRIFDPRLTEEYQQAGEPYTLQNAEGEQAALALGASIWGTANQTNEGGVAIAKTAHIGCRNGYRNLKWLPESPVFERAGASGLTVTDWQNVILVNMLGQRFYDETAGHFNYNTYGSVEAYEPVSYTHLDVYKRQSDNIASDINAG